MNIKDIPKGLLGTVSSILEKKTVKVGEGTYPVTQKDREKLEKLYMKAFRKFGSNAVAKLATTDPKLLSPEQNKIRKEIEAIRGAPSWRKRTVKEVDEPAPEGEKSFKNFHLRDLEVFEKSVAEARDILFPDGDQIPIGIGPKADAKLLGWIRKRVEAKPTDKKDIEKRLKIYFRNRPKKLNLLKSFWDGFSEGVEEAGPRWIPDEPGDRMPTGIGPKADEELVMWLKKRLKARPQDKEYVEKLLKKLRVQKSFWKKFYGESVESVEEAGPRWMPDEPDDQIPSANWYGPKADSKLVVWLKKRLKVKPRDKKYVDRLLNYIDVKKPFWKKFYEGADKDVTPKGYGPNEEVEEEFSKKEVSGKIIAKKMQKSKTLKGFANRVAKMKMTSADELDKILPDYVSGGDIAKLFGEEVDLDEGGDKEAYQKFFQGMLKKFGVKSPAELSGDKKKEFFDAIDAGWKADDEKKESADKDVKGDKEAYQKFFQGMLKKFGVKSPAELSGDKKKEFFSAIDAGWKADDEKKESTLDEKINMNALDWGKTTAKRNANLDKYDSLKTSKEKEAFIRALKGKSESKIKAFGSGYKLYHDTFSDAMQHAYDYAKKKLGVTVDPNEIDRYVALGPKKPSKGKTNSYRLKGTGRSKGLSIQVYNTGKSYELNMYAESVDEDIMSEAIEYEIKNGKIYISKKDFAKVHKDYKNTQKGKERMSVMEPKTQGTVSMEVVFEDVYAESVEAVVNFLGENK